MRVVKWIIVAILALMYLLPFYFLITGSFRNMMGLMQTPPPLLPKNLTLENYAVLVDPKVLRWLGNTILVVTVGTASAIFVASLAGYTFSMHRFPGKNIFWWLFLACIMVSRFALIVPTYVSLRVLRISGPLAIVLPDSLWPIGIFLARNYIDSIPRSIVESGRIDGAREGSIMLCLVLPLCKPLIGAMIVFKAVGILQDYIWQKLVLQDSRQQTLVVGLLSLAFDKLINTRLMDYGLNMAIGCTLLLPLIVIFMLGSRYFLGGLTTGGIKE